MQKKTIKKAIEKKLSEWLETITDEKIRADVKKNILVSGGSIASMLLNEPVNDYDIYIQDRKVLLKLVEYLTNGIGDVTILDGEEKQSLVKELEKDYDAVTESIDGINNAYAVSLRNLKDDQIKLYLSSARSGLPCNEYVGKEQAEKDYLISFISPNAISFHGNIQLVIRFHGDAKKIHSTFDFIHATNYFTFEDGLVLNLEAMTSLMTKQLVYQGSQYPLTSIIRAKKFVKRGWNINAGEYLKIMFQISQMDLTNPDVLEEQLIGVDVAYFGTLIDILRGKYDSDEDFTLTSKYLNTLIDKVFSEGEEE